MIDKKSEKVVTEKTVVTPEPENKDKKDVVTTISAEEIDRRFMSPSMITKMEEAKYPREIRVPQTMTDPHPEASFHQNWDVTRNRWVGPESYDRNHMTEFREPLQHQDASDPAYANRDPAKITKVVPTDKDIPDQKKASDPVNLDRDPKFLAANGAGHLESVVAVKKDSDVTANTSAPLVKKF